MTGDGPCPCGSELDYGNCCGPRHSGARPAATAEALMRSRYSAFARGEVTYLVKTLHSSKRTLDTAPSIRKSMESTRWTGLRVLDTEAGSAEDAVGEVEFVAFFEEGGGRGQRHERSRFVREHGLWLYVDGVPSPRHPPPSRREACWCGSGKRYRKCHG